MADYGIYGIGLGVPRLGHNSGEPPGPLILLDIDVLNTELLARLAPQGIRRDDLLDAAERFHAAHVTIESDDTQQRATDFVRQMKACARAIEDTRKIEKLPVLNAQRAIDNLFGDFVAELAKAIVEVERKMTDFARAKVRRAREQAEAEALRLRQEAEALARAAAATNTSLEGAIAVSQAADDAQQRATARPADLSRVHSDLGGVSSLRAIVRHRVVNFDAVPRRYLMLDDAAVRADGVGWREGSPQPIPGIEFYLEEKVTVR
jgi:hypothetical protein